MQEKENGNFSFINEKRKEKPINKKRVLIQMGLVVIMAVIFGLMASFVFAFFQPKFAEMLYPEEEPVVTIPKDSVEETEEQEATEETTEEAPELADEPEPSTEIVVVEPQEVELELEDFQKLQNKMYAVGREANKYVVSVTGVKSDTDWFNNSYESKGQASGIII